MHNVRTCEYREANGRLLIVGMPDGIFRKVDDHDMPDCDELRAFLSKFDSGDRKKVLTGIIDAFLSENGLLSFDGFLQKQPVRQSYSVWEMVEIAGSSVFRRWKSEPVARDRCERDRLRWVMIKYRGRGSRDAPANSLKIELHTQAAGFNEDSVEWAIEMGDAGAKWLNEFCENRGRLGYEDNQESIWENVFGFWDGVIKWLRSI